MRLNQASTRPFYIISAYVLPITTLSPEINSSGYLLAGRKQAIRRYAPCNSRRRIARILHSLPRLTKNERHNTPRIQLIPAAYLVLGSCQQHGQTSYDSYVLGLHRSNAEYGEPMEFDAEMIYPCVAIAGDNNPVWGIRRNLTKLHLKKLS